MDMIQGYARTLAIRVWIRNIFVPMFGMYDWQSRLISFFMRVVQIIGRTIALCAIVLLALCALSVYVIALPLVAGLTLYHLTWVLTT